MECFIDGMHSCFIFYECLHYRNIFVNIVQFSSSFCYKQCLSVSQIGIQFPSSSYFLIIIIYMHDSHLELEYISIVF